MEQTYKFKNKEDYLKSLDSAMPEEWFKKRELGGGKTQKYLPIPYQEAIADMMFSEWSIIDENYQLLVNEIVCTVKIVFTPDYPEAQEQFTTGTASKPIQMDAESKVTDFPAKKKANALEYNLPSVRKSAIGCALEGIGNIFGRNVGRKIDKVHELPANFTLRKHADKEVQE